MNYLSTGAGLTDDWVEGAILGDVFFLYFWETIMKNCRKK